MATLSSSQLRYGVLLVNTGTPEEPTPRAVKRYLKKFLMDRRIVPMNRFAWWLLLNARILPKRSKVAAEKYQAIWTNAGSPLLCTQERMAARLESFYQNRGIDVVVSCAMSYSRPSIEQGLMTLRRKSCDSVVVLPMYPQSAYSTTYAVSDQLERTKRKLRWNVPCEFISDYHDNYAYIRSIAGSIKHAGFEVDGDDRLLFSFHSIPLKDIDAGDTYELQAGASSLSIAGELGLDRKRWTIGYQCRFDKNRDWLQPFTKDVLKRWGGAGEGRVFVVCPNFAVDCLETLYDVPRELRPVFYQAARDANMSRSADDFIYVPCLNSSRAQIRVLVDVLRPYIGFADEME